MALTKVTSDTILDGTIANVDLASDIAVTGGQIADDAVTIAKMAGLTRGSIIVGDSSGDPSALPLGVSTRVLTSDGSDAAWTAPAAGDTNTPAWHVGINSSTQSITDDTVTKVELDDVKFDTGFTWDTTNFRGLPGTAGKYLIGCFVGLDTSSTSLVNAFVYLHKTGASQAWWELDLSGNVFDNGGLGGTTILELGATDYVEMFVYFDFNSTSATLRQIDATQCVTYMFGTKLIGA